MRVLGIDPGTRCGYAWTDTGRVVVAQSGVWDLRPSRFEGGGMRFVRMRRFLEELEPEAIVFEEVRRHLGTTAAHVYGGIVAVVTAYGEEHSVPYRSAPVATIKKLATGKGNADKTAMCDAATREFGHPIASPDQADALWILAWGLAELGQGGSG